MKVIKKIITILVSITLMFIIMGLCLLSSLPTFMNPSTYLNVMEQVGIYQMIQENIQNSLDDLMLINNIDRQTMNQFITIHEVKEMVNEDVYNLFMWLDGTGSQIEALNLTTYESRFDERLATFFRDNHYYLDDEQKQDVASMKQAMLQIINGNIRVLKLEEITRISMLNKLTSLIQVMNVKIVACALVIVGLLLTAFLVLLSPRSRRKNRRKKVEVGLLWSGYGIVAGGLFVFIIFFSGLLSGFYQNIAIQVNYLHNSLSRLIETALKMLSSYGLMAVALGVILMLPYWYRLYKKCMI